MEQRLSLVTLAVDDLAAVRRWAGYSGYFVDPAGFHWEIAWAPGEVGRWWCRRLSRRRRDSGHPALPCRQG